MACDSDIILQLFKLAKENPALAFTILGPTVGGSLVFSVKSLPDFYFKLQEEGRKQRDEGRIIIDRTKILTNEFKLLINLNSSQRHALFTKMGQQSISEDDCRIAYEQRVAYGS